MVLSAGAAIAAPPASNGTYRNPSNSVQIHSQPCGTKLCGVVACSNDKARTDSAKDGTGNLIGLYLLNGFTPDGPDRWNGSVFVPDANKTFSGHVLRTSLRTLKGAG